MLKHQKDPHIEGDIFCNDKGGRCDKISFFKYALAKGNCLIMQVAYLVMQTLSLKGNPIEKFNWKPIVRSFFE